MTLTQGVYGVVSKPDWIICSRVTSGLSNSEFEIGGPGRAGEMIKSKPLICEKILLETCDSAFIDNCRSLAVALIATSIKYLVPFSNGLSSGSEFNNEAQSVINDSKNN